MEFTRLHPAVAHPGPCGPETDLPEGDALF